MSAEGIKNGNILLRHLSPLTVIADLRACSFGGVGSIAIVETPRITPPSVNPPPTLNPSGIAHLTLLPSVSMI
ncbi:hypothetical protein INR49_032112 [Caranx melampygus]|nr:hypothetical protein INR49_032112 [Caranx melampygus]